MIFMLTIPTENAENKLKTKLNDVPKIVITNEHQMSWTDPKCAAVDSGTVEIVRKINLMLKTNLPYFHFNFVFIA